MRCLFPSVALGRPALLAIFRQQRSGSVRMVHSIAAQVEKPPEVSLDSAGRASQVPGTRSLALRAAEDDAQIRQKYRPFILSEKNGADWVDQLELETVLDMAEQDLQKTGKRLKVLVLYGSLRRRWECIAPFPDWMLTVDNGTDLTLDLSRMRHHVSFSVLAATCVFLILKDCP